MILLPKMGEQLARQLTSWMNMSDYTDQKVTHMDQKQKRISWADPCLPYLQSLFALVSSINAPLSQKLWLLHATVTLNEDQRYQTAESNST